MKLGVVAAATAIALGFVAQAHAQASTQASASSSEARAGGRVVMICDRSAKTRRMFEQEHGAPAIFMSAEQLAKAEAAKESWSAPRCITQAELQRYDQLAAEVRVMRARGD